MVELAQRYALHRQRPLANACGSYMLTCTCNVSVVAINGNIIRIGALTVSSYDVPRFGARARVFESCKGCVAACFGACKLAHTHLVV